MTWEQFITPYQSSPNQLFSPTFLERWSRKEWKPSDDDQKAAAMLHTQVTSRVTTQRLGYLDGVETAALNSIYALFKETRDINARFPEARHFDAVAWEVLNFRVRPFTAKWHRESERGTLAALDATDDFRAQLTQLQRILRRFDDLLLHLRDGQPPAAIGEGPGDGGLIAEEMKAKVIYGISEDHGGIDACQARNINTCEQTAIQARRSHYKVRQDTTDASGLALSGGGIRSATFSLGVLVALAQRGLLPQFDYLSTVSGGGYLGSFLSAFLHSAAGTGIGLCPDDLPFRRKDGEAQALRHVRHHSKYLSTVSPWQKAGMMCAQLYGMALNGLAIGLLVVLAVVVERLLRSIPFGVLTTITEYTVWVFAACALFSLLTLRIWRPGQKYADRAIAISFASLLGVLCVHGLEPAHSWYKNLPVFHWTDWGATKWPALLGAIPVIVSGLAALFGRLLKRWGALLVVVSGIAAASFFFGLYLALYEFADGPWIAVPFVGATATDYVLWTVLIAGLPGCWFLFDINSTSPHRHYRDRLADAFLIQTSADTGKSSGFDAGVHVPLSRLMASDRSPYHLINCALNVPGSKNIAMQGRLTDFFLFTPGFSGSPLTGYFPTREWEGVDSHLDLGTAMAISAAAAAPQMGLGTMRALSFWLALLNVRLGYWAKKPTNNKMKSALLGAPGLFCLWREMLGTMHEGSPWLNLTDGGHIENLGVYELLRRRCKYIVAVDGEEDSKMTFQALTTLQRLAAIDLGVRIDINLDDLRLNKEGLSRSHFRFCRIRYPKEERGSEDEFGYLLYVKLSLTGNEGEFIRRYRFDNPAFPHDSTADQFFTEPQFEAYRSLGEHVGDKLFLQAIMGKPTDAKSVNLEWWFAELGKNLLEPLPIPNAS